MPRSWPGGVGIRQSPPPGWRWSCSGEKGGRGGVPAAIENHPGTVSKQAGNVRHEHHAGTEVGEEGGSGVRGKLAQAVVVW